MESPREFHFMYNTNAAKIKWTLLQNIEVVQNSCIPEVFAEVNAHGFNAKKKTHNYVTLLSWFGFSMLGPR